MQLFIFLVGVKHQPFTTQSRILTPLEKKAFKNIVENGENAGNKHFLGENAGNQHLFSYNVFYSSQHEFQFLSQD